MSDLIERALHFGIGILTKRYGLAVEEAGGAITHSNLEALLVVVWERIIA